MHVAAKLTILPGHNANIQETNIFIINVVTAEDILDFLPNPRNGRREFILPKAEY